MLRNKTHVQSRDVKSPHLAPRGSPPPTHTQTHTPPRLRPGSPSSVIISVLSAALPGR